MIRGLYFFFPANHVARSFCGETENTPSDHFCSYPQIIFILCPYGAQKQDTVSLTIDLVDARVRSSYDSLPCCCDISNTGISLRTTRANPAFRAHRADCFSLASWSYEKHTQHVLPS